MSEGKLQRWDASVDHVISPEKEKCLVSGVACHVTFVEEGNLQKIFRWTQVLHCFVYHHLSGLERIAVDDVHLQGYHEHCCCLETKKTGGSCKTGKLSQARKVGNNCDRI